MAYKLIDDETALQIYEAVQENTQRSFGSYDRLRQLPRTKVDGEIVFYLDVLLDFAKDKLGRDEAETLRDVIDAGVVSWFGNLTPELQEEAGFSVGENRGSENVVPSAALEDASDKDIATLRDELSVLRAERVALEDKVSDLEQQNVHLKREFRHLEQIHEEMVAKNMEESAVMGGPAFLAEATNGSMYTEMTTHMLSPSSNDKSTASKKRNNRRKKRG